MLDANIFQMTYIPEQLRFRGEQQNDVAHAFVTNSNLLLYGETGTGKTLVVNYVKNAYLQDKNPNAKVLYISCLSNNKPKQVWEEILKQLLTRPKGWRPSEYELYTQVMEVLPNNNNTFLILDEVDKLTDVEDFLKVLCDEFPLVTLFLITNNPHFPLQIRQEVKGRLGWLSTNFMSYSIAELTQILTERAEKGLRESCWDDRVIKYISARVKKDRRGDARVAISVLRISALLAEREETMITESLVDKAFLKYEADEVMQTLYALPDYSKAIYVCVNEYADQSISSGDLYSVYAEFHVKKLKLPKGAAISYTTFWRATNELAWANLIAVREPTLRRGRGQTRDIYKLIPPETYELIKPILYTHLNLPIKDEV
jgi:Cdc6-like AAA superfamily ATPase